MKTLTQCPIKQLAIALLSGAILAITQASFADIAGPYTPDANTLHLWHLNESAVPAVDSAVGGTNLTALGNGATLNNPSFSVAFGTALSTVDGGQAGTNSATLIDAYLAPRTLAANTTDDTSLTYMDPVTGAFTFEAIVWVGFNPQLNMGPVTFITGGFAGNARNSPMHIISGENDAGTRSWQLRLDPIGFNPGAATAGVSTNIVQPALEFINVLPVTQSIIAFLPTNGPDAIVSNQWYHVAVTYNGNNGTADNFKMYWSVLSGSYNQAVELRSATLTNDLSVGAVDFAIGNIGRNAQNGNFIGLIDEVRMSKVARAANGMMFAPQQPVVTVPPQDTTVPIGNPASFSVAAAGLPVLSYQWRHAGTNLPGATLDSLSIASAQQVNAGLYDVIVANGFGSVTSVTANLTIRLPIDLTWIGSAGGIWNNNLVNWDTNADNIAETAFTAGDNVTFDSAGSAVPVVLLTNILTPHAMAVNANFDYTLTTTNGASIGGFSQLTKSGSGSLILDVDCTFVGPTTIAGGTLQMGNASARGSLGNGAVTNNGSLIVSRTGTVNFNSYLVGSGSLTNNATNNITISGTNLMSGPITLNAGALNLSGAAARGGTTQYVVNATANATGPTRLTVGGGMTFGPGTSISLLGSTASPDYRASLTTSDSTNVFNCAFDLSGDGNIQFISDGAAATSLFQIDTPVINAPGYIGQLIIRGNGSGVLASQLNLGNKLSKTDGGVWTITSTGNSWVATDVAGGRLRMGANNVFPSGVTVNITTAAAVLDLGGFNQSINTLTGPGIIANSSTNADSVIIVSPSGLSLYTGSIQDSTAGGTRKSGLTVGAGTLTLSGTNTYTGPTTVTTGTLELLSNGQITNSATINVADGATLSAQLRTDGTFTLNPAQTLKGDGAFNVLGSLTNNGTIELKVIKSGVTLTNDSVNNLNTITYGGTLKLNVTASPTLTTNDTFKLFNAGLYQGAFTSVTPASPAPGLAWDTSTLTADGTIRLMINPVNTTPTNITFSIVGNQIALSWPADHTGWRLQMQTNSINVGLRTNWVDVSGSTGTNAVFLPTSAATAFFRMVYP